MTKDNSKNLKEQVFYKMFPALYYSVLKDPNSGIDTQQQFASRIPIARTSVSEWLNGKRTPTEEHLNRICEICNVDRSVFDVNRNYSQIWIKYSDPDFVKSLPEEEILPYCEAIGLNINFLKALHELTRFNDLFPVWSPIVRQLAKIQPYERMDLDKWFRQNNPEAAQVKEDYLQIVAGNKQTRVFLQAQDLLFIRFLQDQFSYFMEYQFQLKADEMNKEVEEACRAALHKKGDSYKAGDISLNEMKAIDRGLSTPTIEELKENKRKDEYLARENVSFTTPEEYEKEKQRIIDRELKRQKEKQRE